MRISLIAALAKNRVIGNENKLLWKLPADMKRFVSLTTGKPIIMGRKTFESIGKPLKNRTNIVLTHDKHFAAEGCVATHSVEEALAAAGEVEEVMIIGGEQIYKLLLDKADRMYLTFIDKEFTGDAFFPEYDEKEWTITEQQTFEDEQNDFSYSFVTLSRN